MTHSPYRLARLGMATLLLTTVAIALPSGAETGATKPDSTALAVARILEQGPDDTFAFCWLQQLCDLVGARLSGSPEYEAASRFAVRSLETAGFDRVYTEPVTVPVWRRGVEEARVVAPIRCRLPVSALGGSIGTPDGGLEAEVLAVSDFAELAARSQEARGRIVLFNPPWQGYGETVEYRGEGAIAAARLGAVAVLVRSITDHSLATLHTGVMSYDPDVEKIPAAAITVEDAGRLERLSRDGRTVRVRMELGAQNDGFTQQDTVIAEITGRELPQEIVLVGGHLDSWDLGPGAHDDGAGCAIAVGAAQLIHKLGLRPRRTLRVVLFASEEFGGQAGDAYLEQHRNELDWHVAAIESDSGGFPPRGFSARTTPAILGRIQALAAPLQALGAAEVQAGWAGVDIGPIVEAGVPGIGVRTQNEAYFSYHHSPADTLDKVDATVLAANVTAVAALAWSIADRPDSLRIEP